MRALFFLSLFLFLASAASDEVRTPYEIIKSELAITKVKNVKFFIRPIVVAVIDSGTSLFHPDISPFLHFNEHEKTLPVGDWDSNTYLNDYIGYDFVGGSGSMFDGSGHGTHVAGIITQVNPYVRILPVKVLDKNGKGKVADVIEGIKYAVARGARIINLSLGALDILHSNKGSYEKAVHWARRHNVLVVVAAGNNGMDNDVYGFYPSNIWEDNLISICSTDHNNRKSDFSNYGADRVHLCAPGENVLAANHLYVSSGFMRVYKSGTSMAAPLVTAAASLLLTVNPVLKPYQLRNILMESSAKFPDLLDGVSQTKGVLNLSAAINMAFKPPVIYIRDLIQPIERVERNRQSSP